MILIDKFRNEVINEIEKVFGNSAIKIENNRKILDKQLIKSLIFEYPKKKIRNDK